MSASINSVCFKSCRVVLSAHLDHFQEAWGSLESDLSAFGADECSRWQWYLVLLELVNNAIVHGSKSDRRQEVLIEWALADGVMELSVSDKGQGPPSHVTRNPSLPKDMTERRGRGLCLVHNFCDSWEHWRSDSGYRCLIRKRLDVVGDLEWTSFDSVGRSVTSLSAFYQLGASILHKSSPAAFILQGLELLVDGFARRPRRILMVLSDRVPVEIADEFRGQSYVASIEETPPVTATVIRGGRGTEWGITSLPEGVFGPGCCHPIVVDDRNLGCLFIENEPREAMSMSESAQARVFADLFGIAIENYRLQKNRDRDERFRRETEFAARIQRDLLAPKPLPTTSHWEIAHYGSAHGIVAGDYQEACYDADGNLIMAIIDVMGKGATAAIFALMFRTALHARLQTDFSIEGFLASFNNTLHEWLGGDTRFITCTLAKIRKGGSEIEVVNAGHCPTLLFCGGELVHEWRASGPPLGVFADSCYQADRAGLDEVDTLLFVSDGIYEWFEGDHVWGWAKFVDFAREWLHVGHDAFWNRLQAKIFQSVDDPSVLDDQTLLWWSRTAQPVDCQSVLVK